MIEELRKNIDKEIEVLKEISIFSKRLDYAEKHEKKLLLEGMDSLAIKIKEINGEIPALLETIEIGNLNKETEVLNGREKNGKRMSVMEAGKKEAFMKELDIEEGFVKNLGKRRLAEKEEIYEFKKSRGYLKLANRFFLESSQKLIKKGYFRSLPSEIKKSNLEILFETYIAMMLFSVLLSFVISLLMAVALFIFGVSLIIVLLAPIVIPLLTFIALYYYPMAEKRSLSKRIDEELPFAVIHMSSISGAGIEPTEIFKIIGLSKDYPFLRKEIRKILNQINIYGYDLVSSLNSAAKTTANAKFAELLNGLSTTINSGGSLSDFFQKRAELLMLSYRLDKEKFIKLAETFMDIYISVVIAAPMILMLLLVMISVSGIQTGFTTNELTIITILSVSLINIVFLGFLQAKQ